jgi:hypothetical protein
VHRSALTRIAIAVGVFAAVTLLVVVSCPCKRATDVTPQTSGETATAAAVTPPAADAPGLFHAASPMGVTTGVGMIPPRIFRTYDRSLWPAEAERDVEMLAGAHSRWYRHHTSHFPAFDQRTLERSGFDWTHRDLLVQTVQAAEIDILLMIGRTSGIASCRQFSKDLPAEYLPAAGDEESRYREYVRRVVERYDGDGDDDMPGLVAPIRWFQLGNENDLHYEACQRSGREYASPEQYLELSRITAEAMAEASEDAHLAASMTFGHITEEKSHWTERLLTLEDGAVLEVIDAVDMHDYSTDPRMQLRRIGMLHDLTGGRVPIWITETSVPGDAAARKGWDLQRQARILPQLVCQALASGHVDRVFWHALSDGPPVHDSRQWRAFGTNSLYGCVDPVTLPGQVPECSGFERKPVGRTFALMADALEGWTAVEPLDGVEGWRIRRAERGDALVLLAAPGTEIDAAQRLGATAVRVWNLVDEEDLGGEQPRRMEAGALSLGADPWLIEGADR